MNDAVGEVGTEAALEADLIESDRLYFEAGARLETLEGATLSVLPGFETMHPGFVVTRVDAGRIADADRWVEALEARARVLGATPRLYLDRPHAGLERALARGGFAAEDEIGFAFLRPAPDPGDVRLVEVATEAHWDAKRALYAAAPPAPHGERTPAEAWVAFERLKTDAGYMTPYLIQAGGEVCGAVAEAPVGRLSRIKNLVVHPGWRRKGLAMAGVAALARQAAERGFAAVGLFAVAGGAAERLYRKMGWTAITRQTEWTR